jgi:Putative SAM-dependent methyltransferase
MKVHFNIHDMADYGICNPILNGIVSKYHPNTTMSQIFCDLLSDLEPLVATIQDSDIVTSCFLLNEIITESKKSFVSIMTLLVNSMKKGALLLIIDPASDFSQLEIASKSYMIFKLMDAIESFQCLEAHNSKWYRFDPVVSPFFNLQNQRFFLRIYRKK